MTKNLADELQQTARAALAGLQPTPQGEEVGGLSFRRLIAAAFRARFLLFATTLFGLLVGTFLAITTANRYVSTGTFQFTGTGAERTIADPTRTAETSQETIATSATYILNTDDLLKKVVKRLGPAVILQPYQPGGPDDSGMKALFFRIQRDWNSTREEDRTPEEALKRLKKSITVERPRFTDVVLVTCAANNAQLAQEILGTYMDEAIKTHIEKYDSARAYEQSQKSFEDARAAHLQATKELNEFLERKAKVEDFDGEKERLAKNVQESEEEVRKLLEKVAVDKKQIEALTKQLTGPNAIPMTRIEKIKPILANDLLATKRLELWELAKKLATTKAEFQPGAHEVRVLEREIEATRGAIEEMEKMSRGAELVEQEVNNPVYLEAQNAKTKFETDLTTAETALEFWQQVHTERTKRHRDLMALAAEYETLRTAKKHAEVAENAAGINFSDMERKRLLGQGNFSALKDIEPATLPLEKDGPNRGKLLLGGFFVGLFLGLGIIVLRALPDTVVRTRDDLEQIEGLAVIGTMPRLDGPNLRRHVSLREQGW